MKTLILALAAVGVLAGLTQAQQTTPPASTQAQATPPASTQAQAAPAPAADNPVAKEHQDVAKDAQQIRQDRKDIREDKADIRKEDVLLKDKVSALNADKKAAVAGIRESDKTPAEKHAAVQEVNKDYAAKRKEAREEHDQKVTADKKDIAKDRKDIRQEKKDVKQDHKEMHQQRAERREQHRQNRKS